MDGCNGSFVAVGGERLSWLGDTEGEKVTRVGCWEKIGRPHVGLILSIISPFFDFTNSLFMKRPMGWSYLRPLGAVRETVRSDILVYSFPSMQLEVGYSLLLKVGLIY